ncbi:alpha/beta hydrolase [Acidobacteriota bacterium]
MSDRRKTPKRILSLLALGLILLLHPWSVTLSAVQSGYKSLPLIKIFSQSLNEERTIQVQLPLSYETNTKSYPVLYVLDAESQNQINSCISAISDLRKRADGPEMIIVGIWNTNRNRDMIPQAVSHRPGSGGSLQFLEFIRTELIPHIEQSYRASGYSMIYGASNAGIFTVYAFLESPDTFNIYLASSPMIGHCPDFMENKLEAFLKRRFEAPRALYMIYGTEDSRRVTEFVPDLYNNLKSRSHQNTVIQLEILEGEGHVPASSLHRGLQYILENTTLLKSRK